MKLDAIRAQLILHENMRLFPYKDSIGKLTIGVGRNLDDTGISAREALLLLDNDIDEAISAGHALLSNFDELDDVRQHVVIDMAFNLGRNRLKGFRKMLQALRNSNFKKAADEMVDSRWYKQVGTRAVRLERMMRTGENYV